VIPAILGGIGLFLLGMVLMTDGLRAIAGEALRQILSRFTGGPWRAFVSGAAATILVQSSSATVLATLGFVSAGLLGFTQAVGVIFGAALGTTSTGWIVALVGLRFSISVVALPLIGIGALLRLLARGRNASIGLALAGFGLIFVGIDTLQGGMEALATRIDPAAFPSGSVGAWAILVAVGIVMTVVMQSSSAAVATTLAALHSGTILLDQAGALVVGQNMGTAVTAALASIGASTAARRTALAHVLFNGFAGVVGLLLLPVLLYLAPAHPTEPGSLAVSVAAFHSGFNLIAVCLILPVVGTFSGMVKRMLPERGPHWSHSLDPSVAELGPVAVETARRATAEIGALILDASRRLLRRDGTRAEALAALDAADTGLEQTRQFLAGVRTSTSSPDEHRRHLSVLHALDHFGRMTGALREQQPARVLGDDPALHSFALELAAHLEPALVWLRGYPSDPPLDAVRAMSREIADLRRSQRPAVMARTAAGDTPPALALMQLDAMRWVDRIAYHTWRAIEHLGDPTAVTLQEGAVEQEPPVTGPSG